MNPQARRSHPLGQARGAPHWSPGLLDRLIDEAPAQPADPPGAFRGDLADHKRSIARDLEVLLNTRRPSEDLLAGFPLANASMLGFGIMDLSTVSLHDPRGHRVLQDHLRLVIERHEPRLGDVRVAIETVTEGNRALRFRVDGVLRAHPDLPGVAFDAMLQLGSHLYHVRNP